MIAKIQLPYRRSVKNGGKCGKVERTMSNAERAAVVHSHPIATCQNVGLFRYLSMRGGQEICRAGRLLERWE